MNIVSKITVRQMKTQKDRTRITLIGIIIAVAMIAAVSSFSTSLLTMFHNMEMLSNGNWHVCFSDMTPEQYALVRQDARIADTFVMTPDARIDLPMRIGHFYFTQRYFLSESAFSSMQCRLLEGRLPKDETECIISENFAKTAALQLLDHAPANDLVIVGIAQIPILESSDATTAVLLSGLPEAMPSLSVYAVLRDPGQVYDLAQDISAQTGCPAAYHDLLLVYSGVNTDNPILPTIYGVFDLFLVLIIIAAISMIYNSFAISVTDRSAQFGMLASIGATPRQRRNGVLFEALSLALIAIPIGLLLGYLGLGLTFRLVNAIIRRMASDISLVLSLVIDPRATLLAIVLALVTVLISAFIPAIRAARVSPMEAIRATADIKLTARQVKTSRLSRRLFGFEGELALKNLRRNRKRYRITQISLVISLVLFMSTSSLTANFAIGFDLGLHQLPACDIQVTLFPHMGSTATNIETASETLLNFPNATSVMQCYQTKSISAETKQSLTADAQALFPDSDACHVTISAVDDATFAMLAGSDAAALREPGKFRALLYNTRVVDVVDQFALTSILDIAAGDALPVTLYAHDADGNVLTTSTAELEIVALRSVPESFMSVMVSRAEIDLLVTKDTLIALTNHDFFVDTFLTFPDAAAAQEALDHQADLWNQDAQSGFWTTVENLKRYNDAGKNFPLIVNIFTYSFITLLSLVGIANVVGTISTGFMLRKREFAMLQSAGIAPRSFRRMIRYESILYGWKAICYGVPISYLVIFLLWRSTDGAFMEPFDPLIPQMLIGVLGIFVLVLLTTLYSSRKIKHLSIIEALRQE